MAKRSQQIEIPPHLRVYSEPADPGPITVRHGGPLPDLSGRSEQLLDPPFSDDTDLGKINRRDALAQIAGLLGAAGLSGLSGMLPVQPAVARARKLANKLGLTAESTLPDVVEKFYLPVVLAGRCAKDQTINVVRDVMRWWHRLTRNPPVFEIDDELLTKFKLDLKRAYWQRGKLASSPQRFLSPATIAKLLRTLRSVLMRCGPTTHPKRPGLWLVDDVPYIEIAKPQSKIKARFQNRESKRIFEACDLMDDPPFWRGCVATFLYGGERLMDSMSLCESQIETVELEDGGIGHVWHGVARKTGKDFYIAMHPCWLHSLAPLRAASRDRHAPLLKWEHCWRHFQRKHERLQRLAGIKNPLCVHAWRRTHIDECVVQGLALLNHTAKKVGNHSDLQVTRSSYTDPANRARLALPNLFDLPKPPPPPDPNDPQLKLFD